MYTIKEAAARTGVSVQLIRAWERRYSVVDPLRASSGYRLYDDKAIARLSAMRRLVDDGWAPSTAAARIRELADDAVREIAERSAATDTAQPQVAANVARALVDAFVAAAAKLDERGVEHALDEMFAMGSFEQVASELVMPALVALGEAWAAGRLDVGAEHAAAGAVSRRLGLAFMAAGVPADTPVVLVGLPPGSRHDLGALTFATAARRTGISVRYLGSDLPVQDWLEVVGRTGAQAVVIGVILNRDVRPAGEVARAIRDAHPKVLIAFGGHAARSVATAGLEPVVTLPDDLSEAVEQLRDELQLAS